ncbi:MAG TPA: endonuclease/exonuclease/phosphatase family protein [Pseudolabrys sp.]|nr:endonuclease/exonuclease/phosphatase family protein [Pseudolabrys sp.]
MRLSVLTLNLWNISDPLAPRMAALEAGLKTLRPDIVCLQEVADDPRTGQRQSAFAAKACGLTHAVDNRQLSILSRFPVERSCSIALPEIPEDEPRQMLMADVRIEGRLVLVANTHLCWRVEWLAERKTQVDVLLPAIECHGAREATILSGDFNDDPDSPAVRAVASRLTDAFAVCHPDKSGLTWVRQNPYVHHTTERDQRIDYVFFAGALTPISSAVVFNDTKALASDHYGVFAVFELR